MALKHTTHIAQALGLGIHDRSQHDFLLVFHYSC